MNKLVALTMFLVLATPVLGCSSGSSTEGDGAGQGGGGGGGGGGGAGPASATPAPCSTEAQCPSGIRCLHLRDDSGKDGPGFCEVTEMTTSMATPAPCTKNSECGVNGVCLQVREADGGDGPGFCKTDATACPRYCAQSERDEVCTSDADCGGRSCSTAAVCMF